jgi:hypothetical protein
MVFVIGFVEVRSSYEEQPSIYIRHDDSELSRQQTEDSHHDSLFVIR